MHVCMYVCMYVQNKRLCHTISGLKCCIRRTPPHIFWKPQKHVGGVYFMWSGEIFLRNFLPYPPQKNIPGLKGGDVITVMKRRDPSPGTCRKNNPLPPNVGFILFSSVLFFFFSSLALTTSAFHLSILSEVWLLNFLRQYFQFHFLSVKVILIRPYVTQINVILINIFLT